MSFDLNDFDNYRENNRLEVKAANGGFPGSLWETYAAFANSYGGCIVCGVAENKDGSWKTTGLKNLPKLKKSFWDTIHNKKKISLCLVTEKDVQSYTVKDDVVLVIKVPRAARAQKPVFLNNDVFGSTFRRDYEGDYHCTESEVKAMIRDSADETSDMRILKNRRIADFSKESVRNYRIRYNTRHDGHPWTRLSDADFLIRIGAATDEQGEIYPTAAGLLMFGQEYVITREFPEYFLDYREKLDPSVRWTDRVQSQSGDWSGNVFDFFSLVYPKVTADFKKPFITDGPYRLEESPKHLAVREAIVNCLVNADYYQKWGVIIERYPDKIILANPGLIRLGKAQMLKGGISDSRNKNILKMFNLIGIGERAGSGVPDIYEVWSKEGLGKPDVEEFFGNDKPDRTVLTLPLGSSFLTDSATHVLTGGEASGEVSGEVGGEVGGTVENFEISDEAKKVLEYCIVPRTKADIQNFLNIKSERYVRENIINPLVKRGVLKRTIPDKPSSPKQKYIKTQEEGGSNP